MLDEASVVAEAKARLPAEPGKSDPSACRIGLRHSQLPAKTALQPVIMLLLHMSSPFAKAMLDCYAPFSFTFGSSSIAEWQEVLLSNGWKL